MSQIKTLALMGAMALAVSGCGDKERASQSPNINSQIAGGIQETTVPGMGVTTNVVGRTGSMSSGTANSSTVAGAAPPGKMNPADAH